MINPLQTFVQDLTAFLQYKKDEGIHTVDISPETLAAFREMAFAKPPVVKSAGFQPPPKEAAPAEKKIVVTGKTLDHIAGQIRTCSSCSLQASRNQTVPGEGNSHHPDILFIGEGPGPEDDEQGRPFSGEAGQLLDKMIQAMGYSRADVFITTLVKCRPPALRIPLPNEIQMCQPYLDAQIALIRPKIIVALGKTVVETLLGKPVSIVKMRGTWFVYQGIDVMPTYHPGYLLKSPTHKGDAWSDLKAVLTRLGKAPPTKK